MPAERLRIGYLGDPNSTHTRRWASWFARQGHTVVLLVAPHVTVTEGMPAGITVVHWPPYGGGLFKPFRYIAARRVLRRLVRGLRLDILHVHYLTTYGWLAWISGFRPYGITAWGSDLFHDLGASRRNAWFGRLALRSAAFVTADSVDLLRACIAGGARRDRCAVVQFGVEVERFSPVADPALRKRLGIPAGRRIVFSPRTIMRLYNHDVIIPAFRRLPTDAHLLMSARVADPDELARVRALVSELGIDDRVTIVAEIPYEEMAGYHALADVVVSVPDTDGTPVTMFEAMAAGTPVVASDVPSLREWLGTLTPDLLVPVRDEKATLGAMQAVLEMDPARRMELTDRLRRMAHARGDHERNMQAMEGLYASAVAGRLAIPSGLTVP